MVQQGLISCDRVASSMPSRRGMWGGNRVLFSGCWRKRRSWLTLKGQPSLLDALQTNRRGCGRVRRPPQTPLPSWGCSIRQGGRGDRRRGCCGWRSDAGLKPFYQRRNLLDRSGESLSVIALDKHLCCGRPVPRVDSPHFSNVVDIRGCRHNRFLDILDSAE